MYASLDTYIYYTFLKCLKEIELSSDFGKNNCSKANISDKLSKYQCQHQLVTLIGTSLLYLALIGNLESFPVKLIETLQKISIPPELSWLLYGTNAFLGKTKNIFPMPQN